MLTFIMNILDNVSGFCCRSEKRWYRRFPDTEKQYFRDHRRIQSDVIGDKTYADGKTCQVYSNDQKSVVIDTAYGNERTQVQNILTKFEQDIQTVANTTSGIQFEMELERFEQALERSLSVIPDETTLENTCIICLIRQQRQD